MKKETKKEIHYRCKKCGDEIYWNTHRNLKYCKCKKIWVDGCEDYVRVGGNEADREEIKKVRERLVVSPSKNSG